MEILIIMRLTIIKDEGNGDHNNDLEHNNDVDML